MSCGNATHEGDGDLEQEEAKQIDSVKPARALSTFSWPQGEIIP